LKILIGGLLSLIPIVNLVVVGYAIKVIKNVADGVERPLPNWDEFGDLFVKGLMTALASLIWTLPIMAFAMVMAVFGTLGSNGDAQSNVFAVCMMGMSCVVVLYCFFLGVLLPAAMARYAVTSEFVAFFRVGEIFHLVASHLGEYIISLLLMIVASFIAAFGLIFCCIGVVFTAFWSTLVGPHLLGQLCRPSAAPAVPSPPPSDLEAIA
jgi:hypothetical protein